MPVRISAVLLSISALLLISAAGDPDTRAQDNFTARLIDVGTWTFTSRINNAGGQPECTEIWHFNPDGSGSLRSGEQVIGYSWRVTTDARGQNWLMTTQLSSNDKNDCMGQASDPASFPKEESGFAVLIDAETGQVHMCLWPEQIFRHHGERPQLANVPACFGTIAPSADRS